MADFQDASQEIDNIVEMIDDNMDDISDVGIEYFESTREFLVSVQETINRTSRVTIKQADAIRNCKRGIERWVENIQNRKRR